MKNINTIHLGKAGVTDSVIEEIREQLEKHKVVKVRMLKSAKKGKDMREMAADVSRRVGAELKDVRGNTFILVT